MNDGLCRVTWPLLPSSTDCLKMKENWEQNEILFLGYCTLVLKCLKSRSCHYLNYLLLYLENNACAFSLFFVLNSYLCLLCFQHHGIATVYNLYTKQISIWISGLYKCTVNVLCGSTKGIVTAQTAYTYKSILLIASSRDVKLYGCNFL